MVAYHFIYRPPFLRGNRVVLGGRAGVVMGSPFQIEVAGADVWWVPVLWDGQKTPRVVKAERLARETPRRRRGNE